MNKKRIEVVVFVLVLVIGAAVLLYFSFSGGKNCEDFSCFQKTMARCNYGSFVSEEPEASWGYKIKGKSDGECRIGVTLLQAKEGDLSLREFEGHSMICTYDYGIGNYPEKDLSKCHGRLKEDLQEILIKKLHSYIVDNLDEIKDDLFKLV